jgi:hypothetical protein
MTAIPISLIFDSSALPPGPVGPQGIQGHGLGINVMAFGAVGDGVTDDTAAIQAAIASAGGGPCALYLPKRHVITGRLAFTDQHVTLRGNGEGVSRLICKSLNAGITFTDTYNGQDSLLVKRLSVDGLSIDCDFDTPPNTGPEAITAVWSYTGVVSHVDHARFSNLTINGHGFTRFWNVGIRIKDAGCVQISNVSINNQCWSYDTEAGIVIERSAASNICRFQHTNLHVHCFKAAVKLKHAAAVNPGTIEGLYFTNCEFVSVRYGFQDDNVDPAKIINGLHFSNGHINASRRAFALGVVSNLHIHGNNLSLTSYGDTSGGGETYCSISTWAVIALITDNRFWHDPATANCNAIVVPGSALRVRCHHNVFENWATCFTKPLADSAPLTPETAVIGPNTLINTGVPGPIGITVSD